MSEEKNKFKIIIDDRLVACLCLGETYFATLSLLFPIGCFHSWFIYRRTPDLHIYYLFNCKSVAIVDNRKLFSLLSKKKS